MPSFTNFTALLADLHATDRMHQLQLPASLPPLHIEAWAMREATFSLSEMCVMAVYTDAHLKLKSFLGQEASLQTRLINALQSGSPLATELS